MPLVYISNNDIIRSGSELQKVKVCPRTQFWILTIWTMYLLTLYKLRDVKDFYKCFRACLNLRLLKGKISSQLCLFSIVFWKTPRFPSKNVWEVDFQISAFFWRFHPYILLVYVKLVSFPGQILTKNTDKDSANGEDKYCKKCCYLFLIDRDIHASYLVLIGQQSRWLGSSSVLYMMLHCQLWWVRRRRDKTRQVGRAFLNFHDEQIIV